MWAQRISCVILVIQAFTFPAAGEKTMDQLISDASQTLDMFAMPLHSDKGASLEVRVELDMLFTPRQWARIQQDQQRKKRHTGRYRRKAIRGEDYRWPRGIIPFEFDRMAYYWHDRAEIQKAMDVWQSHTCLRFVRATSYHRDKIRFTSGKGCASNVGRIGGTQKVVLAPGCRERKVVLHELGHALGFQHEQTRPDRDQHVTIVKENIPPQLLYNFRKFSVNHVDVRRVPYDYRSIMHYGARAFSINGRPTIRTKVAQFQDVIGTARNLSFLDIKLANILYKCHARCQGYKKCPPEGFMDKNCRCVCPGNPVQECTSSGRETDSGTDFRPTIRIKTEAKPTTTSTQSPVECRDQYRQCKVWAERGECGHRVNSVYMKAYCRRSCSLCNGGGRKTPVCRDKSDNCRFWRRQGHCTDRFVDYMRTECPLSCQHCRPHSPMAEEEPNGRSHRPMTSNENDDATDDVKDCGLTARPLTFIHVVVSVLAFFVPRVFVVSE
ncbi:zinc metalloproteinase nas-8-like [Babylonia areolata]|uniref:zinc metalloproteinase nas-8-like n=1 Tax=Babylonia areolata TaxID=304850 RepID=UPI003FD4B99E